MIHAAIPMVFINLYSISHNQVYTCLDSRRVRQNGAKYQANPIPQKLRPCKPHTNVDPTLLACNASNSELGSEGWSWCFRSASSGIFLKVALLVNVLMLGLAWS